MKPTLTPKQARFVELYLVSLNATDAYRGAYGRSGKVAEAAGPRLLGNVRVAEAIAKAQAKRSERTEITQDMVIERWWTLANADARELVEYRRTCCRHCYGVGFGFQLTNAEKVRIQTGPQRAFYETDEEGEEWKKKQAHKKSVDLPMQIGDVIRETMFGVIVFGGIGWDPRKDPNPECPECFGCGVEKVHVHDTRKPSAAAARLYAGVKQTKDGIEVKMHDPTAALVHVAKHLGMFVEKHELTGKDGGPIEVTEHELRDRLSKRIDGLASRIAPVTVPAITDLLTHANGNANGNGNGKHTNGNGRHA